MAVAERLDVLQEAILDVVRTNREPMTPAEVERKLSANGKRPVTAQVRDALLLLISRDLLALTPDRRVEAIES